MKYTNSRKKCWDLLTKLVKVGVNRYVIEPEPFFKIKDMLLATVPVKEKEELFWKCNNCGQGNSSWIDECVRCETRRSTPSPEKECKGIMGTNCPYGNEDCPKCNPTPSPIKIELPASSAFATEDAYIWAKQVTDFINKND